jgi:glutaredoxin 3
MDVDIYTSKNCHYCHSAKQLLASKGLGFREIDLSNDQNLRLKISQQTGHRTVPQIFIDKNFIGGFNELSKHLS